MHKLDFSAEPLNHGQLQIGRLLMACSPGAVGPDGFVNRSKMPEPSAVYLLVIPLEGPMAFSQRGRKGTVGVGDYVLLSQNEFSTITTEASSQVLWVQIPASELRSRLVSVDDHLGSRFNANRDLSSLLINFIRDIMRTFSGKTPSNPEALATEIVNFIALAISAEDRGTSSNISNARYQLRKRIFEFIESQIGNPNLTPKKIAAHNRVSLSYLYSLFSDTNTTVGQFLVEKRLQRAYELLAKDIHGHLTVSEVAYQVGFKNVSHFSRTFSRHFSMAPRDVRQGRRSPKPSNRFASRSKVALSPVVDLYA